MKSPHKLLLPLLLCTLPVAAMAARAPVDELRVNDQPQQPQTAVNQQEEMFFQLRELHGEIRQLRGMVEEMNHELSQLKRRQQDDYLDLDRRIGNAGPKAATGSGGAGNGIAANGGAAITPIAGLSQAGDAEQQRYNRAQKLLKGKNFPEAVAAFEQYIASYPSGKYVPNSYYWLGQVHRINDELAKARDAFAQVVNNYPASSKALDAALKLGKIYYDMGDNAKARALLEQVAAGNTKHAREARQYLNEKL